MTKLTEEEKRLIYEALKLWDGPHCWGFHKGYRLSLDFMLNSVPQNLVFG